MRHPTLLAFALVGLACSRNPATRKVEAFLPSQPEEIALGQEAELALEEAINLYTDTPELTEMVQRVGARVAATTERPDLPWRFRIVDDPSPNAYALPGGVVYVTRGMLAHLNSESELAAVLAHESGHISARHGVRRLEKLARVQHREGLGSTEIFSRELAQLGSRSVQRFLERSRDEELQADDLALRYLERANYRQSGLAQALDALGRLHAPGFEEPGTHPTTVYRRARIHSALGGEADPVLAEEEYLEAIRGLPFGPDPLEGYFKDGAFVHPAMGFRLQLPEHWTVDYRAGRAVAKNPGSDTVLIVSESQEESVRAGMNAVFRHDVGKKNPWSGKVAGFPAAMAEFSMTENDVQVHAFVGFVEFQGKIVQAVAFSQSAQWPAKETRKALRSFEPATPNQVAVQPMRIEVAEVAQPMTLRAFYDEFPSTVPLSTIARINHIDPDDQLEVGQLVKRVRGFNPDFDGA